MSAPRTWADILHHGDVSAAWRESEPRSVWISLVSGRSWDGDGDHTIHEATVREACAVLAGVHSRSCPACYVAPVGRGGDGW